MWDDRQRDYWEYERPFYRRLASSDAEAYRMRKEQEAVYIQDVIASMELDIARLRQAHAGSHGGRADRQ